MLKVRQIVTLLLLVFVTASASSIALYEHICAKEGKNTSLFTPVTTHDHSEETMVEHEEDIHHTCCHEEEEEKPDGINENCCNTDIKILKADQQYYSELNKLFVPFLPPNNSFKIIFGNLPKEKQQLNYVNKPPPYLSVSTRLALLQTYII
ncbi:MAG: hypothetical protein ACPGU5_04110 [Lishizhenia sp.]